VQLKFCPKPCQYLIVDLHKFREKEFAWFSSCGTSEVLLIVVVLLLALGTCIKKVVGTRLYLVMILMVIINFHFKFH